MFGACEGLCGPVLGLGLKGFGFGRRGFGYVIFGFKVGQVGFAGWCVGFLGSEGCFGSCGVKVRGLGGCLGLGRVCVGRFWACAGRVLG